MNTKVYKIGSYVLASVSILIFILLAWFAIPQMKDIPQAVGNLNRDDPLSQLFYQTTLIMVMLILSPMSVSILGFIYSVVFLCLLHKIIKSNNKKLFVFMSNMNLYILFLNTFIISSAMFNYYASSSTNNDSSINIPLMFESSTFVCNYFLFIFSTIAIIVFPITYFIKNVKVKFILDIIFLSLSILNSCFIFYYFSGSALYISLSVFAILFALGMGYFIITDYLSSIKKTNSLSEVKDN